MAATADQGTYVHYDHDALIGILAWRPSGLVR